MYLRARYYDPALSTFTALDPFEGVAQRPMSLNGYSWVEGNPINAIDPTGMRCTLNSIDGLRERREQLIQLARKWNNISTSDCYALTGIDILKPCSESPYLATNNCKTGLSDEAFAYLMASIIHQEGRIRGGNIGGHLESGYAALRENIATLVAQATNTHNSSEGIAQLRPSTARQIFRGFLPDPDGASIFQFSTDRLNEASDLYLEHIRSRFERLWGIFTSPNPFTSIGSGREESAIFEGENIALENEDVALELLAANIYRGILRAKSGEIPGVTGATIFNLAAWHNEGVQHNYNEKADNYSNEVLRHMVEFVEGDCDLDFGRKPAPWLDFKYYNNVDESFVDNQWSGMRKPQPQTR